MRILYISHSNANDGSNIALMNIMKGMIARGHEVAVVTSKVDGPMLKKMESLGIQYSKANMFLTVYPLNKNPFLYILRLLYIIFRQYLGRKAVEKMIHTFNPDLVHTNVGPLGIGYEACKRLDVPHVWHQREYMDLDFNLSFFPSTGSFLKKIKDASNNNIVITRGLFDYKGFRKNSDEVIYDGVFTSDFENGTHISQRANTVLFVGRVEKAKGVYELITAFDQFHKKHPEYSLHIIGGTPTDSKDYEKLCHQYVNSHGIEDSVKFLGRQNNVYDHMAKAKMLVMSSEFEGFGFVTAEAMACGCPVIGRDTAGTKEQFDNGLRLTGEEIGLRFTTIDQLVEAMEVVATSDTSDMCRRAKETALSLYSIEKNVSSIENLYKKILNKQNK